MSRESKGVAPEVNKAGIPAGDERWNLVLRISKTKEFSRAAKLRNFLHYICSSAITGQAQDLHEQQIGHAVFGRRTDYNPAEDNIVRVEARELRKRLARYFAGKGKTEPIHISIPKGGYVPIFETNAEALTPSVSATAQKISWQAWGIAAAIILAIAVVLAVYWAKSGFGSRNSLPKDPGPKTASIAVIWQRLFPVNSPLFIVPADVSLVLLQDISSQTFSLSYYLSGEYGKNLAHPLANMIAPRPYIDLSDLRVTTRIQEAIRPLGRSVVVRYPRYASLIDLDSRNLVFLGSAYSDPWIREFHPHMNFVVRMDPATGNLCFVNTRPQAGEMERYCTTVRPGLGTTTYGLVTWLPNLHHSGNVLILEGTSSGGTEAAGDLVTNPHYAGALRRYLGLRSKDASLPYFQILLSTVVVKSTPGTLKVLAHRIITERGL